MWFREALASTVRLAREKGSLEIHGIKIYIEYPKGSTRTKTGPDGKKWSRKMAADYGRLSKTAGNDGDCIDVFLGNEEDSEKAFVIDQVDKEGNFDEHKTVIGCRNQKEARELYLANYPKGWKCGKITEFSISEFKKWLKKADKSQPASAS